MASRANGEIGFLMEESVHFGTDFWTDGVVSVKRRCRLAADSYWKPGRSLDCVALGD